MFGLGMPEMVVILVIALIIFGPKRLPEMGKAIGKGLREFRDGAEAIKKDVETGIGMDEKTRSEVISSVTLEEKKVEVEEKKEAVTETQKV